MQNTDPNMRLQKFLAHAGLCSRRKAEEYILKGRVEVNNKIVTELGTKIDPEKDKIFFNKKAIILKQESKKIYIALNKPEGYVSSCSQLKSKIILDLIDVDERVYPVGRLDKDSKGLLLLTNDGDLHNKLSHPSFNHEKEYIVTTVYPLSEKGLKHMAKGMVIDKVMTRKAKVKRLLKNKFKIVLKEGKNRQIRKMVGKIGNRVDSLKRVRIANISLENLKEGKWRYLTKKEIEQLTN